MQRERRQEMSEKVMEGKEIEGKEGSESKAKEWKG